MMMRARGARFAILAMLVAATALVGGASGAGAAVISVARPTATPTPAPNVMSAYVWAGPYGEYFNGPFTSVTICESGTSTCQTLHGILIDTGSSGLRIFGALNHLRLTPVTASDGSVVAECMPFGSLTTWGRIAYSGCQARRRTGDLEHADSADQPQLPDDSGRLHWRAAGGAEPGATRLQRHSRRGIVGRRLRRRLRRARSAESLAVLSM